MTTPTSIAEFEQQFADRSGTTVTFLHAHGRYGDVCDCGDAICEGFQMRHSEDPSLFGDGCPGTPSWPTQRSAAADIRPDVVVFRCGDHWHIRKADR